MVYDVQVGSEKVLRDGYKAIVTEMNGSRCTVTFEGTNIVKTVSAGDFIGGFFDSYKPFKEGQTFSQIHMGERRYQDAGTLSEVGEEGTVVHCDDEKLLVYVAFEKLGKTLFSPYNVFYSRSMFNYANVGCLDGADLSSKQIKSLSDGIQQDKAKEEARRKRQLRKVNKAVKEAQEREQQLQENSQRALLKWFDYDEGLRRVYIYTEHDTAKPILIDVRKDAEIPFVFERRIGNRLDSYDKRRVQDFLANNENSKGRSSSNWLKEKLTYFSELVSPLGWDFISVARKDVIVPTDEEISSARASGDLSSLNVFFRLNTDGLMYNLVDRSFWLDGKPFVKDTDAGGYRHENYPKYIFSNFQFNSAKNREGVNVVRHEGYQDISADYEVRYKNGKLIREGSIESTKELLDLRRSK